jgi:hypothetical protein
MMDPTCSREMPSCSATDLAEIQRSPKISSWIWSIISWVVGLRTYQHTGTGQPWTCVHKCTTIQHVSHWQSLALCNHMFCLNGNYVTSHILCLGNYKKTASMKSYHHTTARNHYPWIHSSLIICLKNELPLGESFNCVHAHNAAYWKRIVFKLLPLI